MSLLSEIVRGGVCGITGPGPIGDRMQTLYDTRPNGGILDPDTTLDYVDIYKLNELTANWTWEQFITNDWIKRHYKVIDVLKIAKQKNLLIETIKTMNIDFDDYYKYFNQNELIEFYGKDFTINQKIFCISLDRYSNISLNMLSTIDSIDEGQKSFLVGYYGPNYYYYYYPTINRDNMQVIHKELERLGLYMEEINELFDSKYNGGNFMKSGKFNKDETQNIIKTLVNSIIVNKMKKSLIEDLNCYGYYDSDCDYTSYCDNELNDEEIDHTINFIVKYSEKIETPEWWDKVENTLGNDRMKILSEVII